MRVAHKSIVINGVRLAMLAFVVALAGCASAPLNIKVKPKVEVTQGQIGMGRTYVIEVHNPMQGKPIGKRSSGDNSNVLVENDLALAVAEAVADAMNDMGYSPGHNTADDIRLRIDITSVQFGAPPDSSYSNKVAMHARIKVGVDRGMDHFNGQYGTKGDKRYVLAPGPEQGSEAVSKMMSQALQNMFNDPAFINFLR